VLQTKFLPHGQRHFQASPVQQFQQNYDIAAQLAYNVVYAAKDIVTDDISPKVESKTNLTSTFVYSMRVVPRPKVTTADFQDTLQRQDRLPLY
jgi:hypothetical protein